MAFMQCRLHSAALGKAVEVNVVYPTAAGKPSKVVYLLHGLSDDASVWCRRTSIERYADQRNIAVVMPDGGRGFYTDAVQGANYWSYIAEELPKQMHGIFRLPSRREDTFAAGLSMGGYGALKLALRCPEKFAAAGALSAVTDVKYRFRAADSASWRPELRRIFGGVFQLAARGNDLFALAETAVSGGGELPKLLSICGTDDFMIRDNRRFNAHLVRLKYPDFHAYERPGTHNWEFWDAHIPELLDFFLSGKLPE